MLMIDISLYVYEYINVINLSCYFCRLLFELHDIIENSVQEISR